jgi:hypothetical protein
MIKITNPSKDTTLYEYTTDLYQNTGLDEILEVSKRIIGSTTYNSRMLISFDITNISESIAAGSIVSQSHYLRLSTANAAALPADFAIEVFPISQSWANGIGTRYDEPVNVSGSSWISRSDTNTWMTGGFTAGSTGSWSQNPGGGTWYTSSYSSQSFNIGSTDIKIDVTTIVNDWVTGVYPNEGFIVKLSDVHEQSLEPIGILQYFSADTSTIYIPKLTTEWDDSINIVTSSNLPSTDVMMYMPRLRRAYKTGTFSKMEVRVRPQFPVRTFATSSNYLNTYYLPTSSYYQLRDAMTDEILSETGSSTRISNDGTGSYFMFDTTGLLPERHYRFNFKIEFETGEVEFFDNRYYFKISR